MSISRKSKSTTTATAPKKTATAGTPVLTKPKAAAAISPKPASTVASTVEAKPSAMAAPSTQAIAEAAYFLWLQRGGNDVVNWLEAEAKLRQKA